MEGWQAALAVVAMLATVSFAGGSVVGTVEEPGDVSTVELSCWFVLPLWLRVLLRWGAQQAAADCCLLRVEVNGRVELFGLAALQVCRNVCLATCADLCSGLAG